MVSSHHQTPRRIGAGGCLGLGRRVHLLWEALVGEMRDQCGWGPGQGAWIRHCWAWLGGLSDLQCFCTTCGHPTSSPCKLVQEGRGDAATRQYSLKSTEQQLFVAHIFNARGVTFLQRLPRVLQKHLGEEVAPGRRLHRCWWRDLSRSRSQCLTWEHPRSSCLNDHQKVL